MRCVQSVLAAMVVVCGGTIVMGQVASGPAATASRPAKVPFTVGKETTVVTAPLRAEGTVDYVAAINERYGKGVTPETNGFVKWLEVVGTGDGVLAPKSKAEVLKMCGAKETAAGAEVWETYEAFMKRTKGLKEADIDKVIAELDAAQKAPWRAAEHPDLAEYFKAKEKLIRTVAESAQRPKWWLPIVSSDGKTLLSGLLPSLGVYRDASRVLCARAVLRGTAGDMDGCLADIQTVRKLARQVGSGPTLIERLVGTALDALGTQTLAVVAANGKLGEVQCKAALAALDGLPALPPMVEGLDVAERWILLDVMQWVAIGDHSVTGQFGLLESDPEGPIARLSYRDLNHEQVDWNAVLKNCNLLFDEEAKVMRTKDIAGLKAGVTAFDKAMADQRKAAEGAAPSFARKDGETREAYTERVGTLLISIFLPSVGKSEELQRRSAQQKEMTRVVLAAAQVKASSGKWPAKVEELVPSVLKELPKDIYSAGGAMPFKYLVKPEGVRVYSVGENGRDDGGVREGTEKDDLGVGVEGKG